jgi:hypothetical protein
MPHKMLREFRKVTSCVTKKYQEFVKYVCESIDATDINVKLISVIIPYICITPIDALIYKKWIMSMNGYKTIAGTVYYPLFAVLVFGIPSLIYWLRRKNVRPIPKKSIFAISAYDTVGSLISAFTVSEISIMLNMVVSKILLPMTMVASYFVLNKRYSWSHYLGALVTVCGIFIMAIPKIMGSGGSTNILALTIFILSFIPWTFAGITKESYLKTVKINKSVMNFMIYLFQLCISIPILPILYYFLEQPVVNLPFGEYVSNSLKCQLSLTSDDECKYALGFLLTYQILAAFASVLGLLIVQESSVTTYIILSTLRLPITQMMGYYLSTNGIITFTKDDNFQADIYSVISIIFVIIGTIFYSMKPEKVVKDQYIAVIRITDTIDNREPDNLDFETEVESDIESGEKTSLLKTSRNAKPRKITRMVDYDASGHAFEIDV